MSVWKELFGESQKDAWARLATELGGAFAPGGFTQRATVTARLGGHDLLLDTFTVQTNNSSQTYTRLRAPFVNARGLRFGVHRASIFTGLAKMLGKQDLEIGVPDFDRDFVIQGNDPARVARVLSSPALRALIAAQPRVKVEIADDDGTLFGPKYGATVDVLRFVEGGVIKDVARLRGLFALHAALLEAFHEGAQSFLEVPAEALPAAFLRAVDVVVESLGGDAERVGDTVEARVPDPTGVLPDAVASLRLALPALPGLSSSLRLDAPLPPGPAFTAEKRGLVAFGAEDTGDAAVDGELAVRGDGASARRALRPLAALAPLAPRIEVGGDALVIELASMPADRAPVALGAALDLWQEMLRARGGLAA